MSSEIFFQTSPINTSGTLYAVVRNNQGQPWRTDTDIFENWVDANIVHYSISMTEQGATGFYVADFPSTAPAGSYAVVTYLQAGGSPSISADTVEADGIVVWPGVAVLTAVATPDDWTTLSYVKNSNQISVTTYDNWIQQYITAASRAARSYLNQRQLLSTVYTEARNGENTTWLRVWNYPIISLSQVIVDYQLTTQTTLPNSNFIVDLVTGIIKFNPSVGSVGVFNAGFQNVRIDYTGGYNTIPYDVQTAVAIIVGKLLFTQNYKNTQVSSKKVKDVQINYFNPLALDLRNPLFAEATAILDIWKPRAY